LKRTDYSDHRVIPRRTGSPAIGAGTSTIAGVTIPTVDQRGIARPTEAIDIGAFQRPLALTPGGPIIVALPIEIVTTLAITASQQSAAPVISMAAPLTKTVGKVKVAAAKKSHPGINSAALFHTPKAAKASHQLAIKAHPAAHAKKK
jgi:hypothetical protein